MNNKEELRKDLFYFWRLRHYNDVGSYAREKVRAAVTGLKRFRRISTYA